MDERRTPVCSTGLGDGQQALLGRGDSEEGEGDERFEHVEVGVSLVRSGRWRCSSSRADAMKVRKREWDLQE